MPVLTQCGCLCEPIFGDGVRPTSMKIKILLNSSRQMVFENLAEGYEYSARGTVFLAWYKDSLYAITAAHVIRDFEADEARILIHPSDREFAPHCARATLIPVDPNDPDYTDLAVFPIAHDMFDLQRFRDWPPFSLSSDLFSGVPPGKGTLIFRGFPYDHNGVDFEKCIIRQKPIILEGQYIGPAPMAHCHQIRLNDVSVCSTLDGFSGSPVFWISDDEHRREYRFCGVLIKGSHSSRTAYYVGSEVLKQTFEQLIP